MCSNQSSHSKSQYKCTIIGFITLIFQTLLLCLAITVLSVATSRNTPDRFQRYPNHSNDIYFGKMDKNLFFGLTGILIALSILGIVSAVMLMIGSKYKKPGFLVVYIFYSSTMSILLLVSAILLFLNLRWRFAMATLGLSGLSCSLTMTVNRCYDVMAQDALLAHQNSISNLTLVIEDDSSEDLTNLTSIPAE